MPKHTHLGIIQAVVNRLSTNSFLLKGWSVVLVAALFALAAKEANPLFAYLAYFPCVVFWGLDGYFLWQERLYRCLYDRVRKLDVSQIDFSLNTSDLGDQAKGWVEAVFSQTLLAFHGTILATTVMITFIAITTFRR